VEDAKAFLAFVASAEAQTKWNAAVGQLPTNKNSSVDAADPFLSAGFEMLSSAHALAQFFDRDAPAEMAKAGMEGMQEFLVKPDRLDAILDRLEKVRQRVY
jgi:multiple sugar transport system substrate-binding protein